ncbi:Small RNA 2'-O-methyltransferase [Lamellibrachia satsuma]|nr:Small RNA 2'-O-methyltransferase [Lamellibrachia satsuma]
MDESCPDAVGKETKDSCDNEEPHAMFDPPLSRQRYAHVADILRAERMTRVVDFGCGSCHVFPYLKQVVTIEDITGVDCDRSLLEMKRFAVKPLLSDFQDRYRRMTPLTMRLFHGSLAQYDSRLCNCEAAILIEVIEHLTVQELAAMPRVLFAEVQPQLIIITTPNAEFNVLFPNFSGMRHEDHKFEWTRDEFQKWCEVQTLKYGYSVEFDGVGEDPGGRRDLGHCSQLAVFHRLNEHCGQPDDQQQNFTYELISEGHFPVKKDHFPEEETILMGAKYYMKMNARDGLDGDASADPASVSLHKLMGYPELQAICPDVKTLREVLERAAYRLSANKESVLLVVDEEEDDLDEEYDIEEDDYDLAEEAEDDSYCTAVVDETDWSLAERDCGRPDQEVTLIESVDQWTLDEPPQEWPEELYVENETWSLDDVRLDKTQVQLMEKQTVMESTEDRLGCDTGTVEELDEWVPDSGSPEPVGCEVLERNCCKYAERLTFETSGPEYGQFSDAEEDLSVGMSVELRYRECVIGETADMAHLCQH